MQKRAVAEVRVSVKIREARLARMRQKQQKAPHRSSARESTGIEVETETVGPRRKSRTPNADASHAVEDEAALSTK
eukprot:7238556-Prymnesium_polylepis.1